MTPICRMKITCQREAVTTAKGKTLSGCEECLQRRRAVVQKSRGSKPRHITYQPPVIPRLGSHDPEAPVVSFINRKGRWDIAVPNHNAVLLDYNTLASCLAGFLTKPLTAEDQVVRVETFDSSTSHKLKTAWALHIPNVRIPLQGDLEDILKGFLPEGWDDNRELQVQDMSLIPQHILEGGEPPDAVMVTLEEIKRQFTHLEKGYNCLEIPGKYTWDDVDDTDNQFFMHDMLACKTGKTLLALIDPGNKLLRLWDHGEDSPGAQIKKFLSFRLMSTAGTITGMHQDGGGALTVLDLEYGLKVWSLFDIRLRLAEHLILHPGDRLIMPPGQDHSVYTPDVSLCSGRHFLHYDFIKETYQTASRHAGEGVSNEYIPAVGLLLCLMALSLADKTLVERLNLGSKLPRHVAELETVLQNYADMFPVPERVEDKRLYDKLEPTVTWVRDLALKSLHKQKKDLWLAQTNAMI